MGDGDDGVRVTGRFISDSQAAGCLLVLVGPSTSPDIFRALQRPHLEQGTTMRVPPSTYTVYGYDIEEDELPNTMPAVILDRQTITNSTSKLCIIEAECNVVSVHRYYWGTKAVTDTKQCQCISE